MLSHTQNYINNKELVHKLIGFVDFTEANLVIEVGPGKGIITDELLRHASRLKVIEADKRLFALLKDKYKHISHDRLHLVPGDFLKYELPKEPFLVVSNIPFNITVEIIRKLTDKYSKLQSAYLIMQKEAAVKFLGAPHAHSPLFSHFLQIHYTVEHLLHIPRANYNPRPNFDTSFIAIKKRATPVVTNADEFIFKDFITFLFQNRKSLAKDCLKSLFSGLQTKIILSDLGIPENSEKKKIIFDDWVRIFRVFQEHAPERGFIKINLAYKKLVSEQRTLKKIHRTRAD